MKVFFYIFGVHTTIERDFYGFTISATKLSSFFSIRCVFFCNIKSPPFFKYKKIVMKLFALNVHRSTLVINAMLLDIVYKIL